MADEYFAPKTRLIMGLAKRAIKIITIEIVPIRRDNFFMYPLIFSLVSNPEKRGLTTEPRLEIRSEKNKVILLAAEKIPASKLPSIRFNKIISTLVVKTEKTLEMAIHFAKWNILPKIGLSKCVLIFNSSRPKVTRRAIMVEMMLAVKAVEIESLLVESKTKIRVILMAASMIWLTE